MESRTMVLIMNFFAGHQWRNSHREETYGHGERGGDGEMYGESNMETYPAICTMDKPTGICCMAQENSNRGSVSTQRGGWGGRWERGSKGRGYMYTYG